MVYKILKRDYSIPVTVEYILQAKEELILRRDTHLDSLVDKLREERVKRVLMPILTGEYAEFDPIEDDIMYVKDLGLIRSRNVNWNVTRLPADTYRLPKEELV